MSSNSPIVMKGTAGIRVGRARIIGARQGHRPWPSARFFRASLLQCAGTSGAGAQRGSHDKARRHMPTSEEKAAELRRAALDYHEFPTPGKVAIAATKQLVNPVSYTHLRAHETP